MVHIRPRLVPDARHPITIEPSSEHVVVRAGSTVVAETDRALELREASYRPVLYIPLADVDRSVLRDSTRQTFCPYKGDASYYDVVTADGTTLEAAVWHYPEPFEAMAQIAGHVAFYADRVQIETSPRS
jgi:uncharacterized protein (DUF427 family)